MDKKCFKWTTTISEAQLRDYFNDGSKLKEPKVDDRNQDEFDEYFAYDAQGRITVQRRGANVNNKSGGEYVYYSGTNKLKSVANGMGGTTADKRDMSASDNFEYDAEGNMTKDNSKDLTIAYDWRGMPVEFKRFRCTTKGSTVCDSVKLVMAYDGSGRRISKTRLRRDLGASDWAVDNVTHYTGISTEVRETHVNGQEETKVVVNLPEGLGRYQPEDAEKTALSTATLDENGRPTSWSVFNPKFEWYLKNHLGSTMMVYGTGSDASANGVKAAYDYRAFGERVDYTVPTDKITETFTGKELDDETQLSNHGARMLDPMLGMWISVDPKRFFPSPYLYMGNGYNPIKFADLNGEEPYQIAVVISPNQVYGAKNGKPNDLMQDFIKTMQWGRNKFGDDFAIKVISNEYEYVRFIQNGKYTATVTHGVYENQPTISPDYNEINLDILLSNVEDAIDDQHVGVFSCFSGNWGNQLTKISVNPENKGLIETGEAFKQASKFLEDGYNNENQE